MTVPTSAAISGNGPAGRSSSIGTVNWQPFGRYKAREHSAEIEELYCYLHTKVQILQRTSKHKYKHFEKYARSSSCTIIILSPADCVIRMASVEIKEPTNQCDFKTGYRTDGSRYTYKDRDCGSTTCKYSSSYVPPPAQ